MNRARSKGTAGRLRFGDVESTGRCSRVQQSNRDCGAVWSLTSHNRSMAGQTPRQHLR
jgi:hypothetical protein